MDCVRPFTAVDRPVLHKTLEESPTEPEWMVPAVGIEPTTNGLQNRSLPLSYAGKTGDFNAVGGSAVAFLASPASEATQPPLPDAGHLMICRCEGRAFLPASLGTSSTGRVARRRRGNE